MEMLGRVPERGPGRTGRCWYCPETRSPREWVWLERGEPRSEPRQSGTLRGLRGRRAWGGSTLGPREESEWSGKERQKSVLVPRGYVTSN